MCYKLYNTFKEHLIFFNQVQDPLPGLLMDQCLVRYGLSITEIYELYTSQMITSSGLLLLCNFRCHSSIIPVLQSLFLCWWKNTDTLVKCQCNISHLCSNHNRIYLKQKYFITDSLPNITLTSTTNTCHYKSHNFPIIWLVTYILCSKLVNLSWASLISLWIYWIKMMYKSVCCQAAEILGQHLYLTKLKSWVKDKQDMKKREGP